MRVLPWLTSKDAKAIYDRFQSAAISELERRHWGTRAPGTSPGGSPKVYVLDMRGLFLAAGVLRYALTAYDTNLLYRGQRKDYELVPSLYRGAATRTDFSRRELWLAGALKAIASVFDPKGSEVEREALAQHYGLATRWLDVVDHIQTAAWFAYYSSGPREARYDDGVGYINVLAYKLGENPYVEVYDPRRKPSTWLRPHIQQAFSIRRPVGSNTQRTLYFANVVTFIASRALLRSWSGYDEIPPETMFPNALEDRGARFWERAKLLLEKQGIGTRPS